VIELARRELGLEVVERAVDRTELYVADEIFLIVSYQAASTAYC
jgi:branched-subunit amino acid aminotransferase/4-amino-4-deoxychorismate lyase